MCHGAGSLVHAEKNNNNKNCSAEIPFGTHGSAATWFRTWKHPELSRNDHGQHGTTSNHWFPKATNDQLVLCWGPPFQETHICQSKSSHLCHCRCERSMDILSKSHDSCLHATFACAAGEKISICGQQGPVSSAGFQHATSNNDWSMGPMAMLNLALKSPCYSSMRQSPKDEDFCGFHLFIKKRRNRPTASPSNGHRTCPAPLRLMGNSSSLSMPQIFTP